MKNLIIIVMLLITSTSYGQSKCHAITQAGKYCSRNAVKAGYCKQHYTIRSSPKVIKTPSVSLPEEWEAISTDPRNPDVVVVYRDTVTNVLYMSFRK